MRVIKLFKETNEIQRVITLRNSRNSRQRYKEFILEGRIAIDQAFEKKWKIKAFFYNKDHSLSDWAKNHLKRKQYKVAYELPGFLMDKIADKTESTEMIAIAETQVHSFAVYKPHSEREVIIVLDSPKSAGNMGMMIRSAVAFGAHAIVISGHAADEYDPKCIRASVGTFFSIPIYQVEGVSKFIEKIEELKKDKKVILIASGDKGAVPIEEAHFEGDLLFLILGNETRGINTSYKEIATQFIRIPLLGKFTSLNIAAAGSIFLYEIFRNWIASHRRLATIPYQNEHSDLKYFHEKCKYSAKLQK
jgi:tRNA G18 (ribose-2'-O)-methylase SpoU